jgi:hypothetical protein
MTNSYGIARRTWKWTNKLFLHLLDITILNAFILHKSSGGKLTHKKFRETLVRDLITQCQSQWRFFREAKSSGCSIISTRGKTFSTLGIKR